MTSSTRSFVDRARGISRPIVASPVPLADGSGALRSTSVLLSLTVSFSASVAAVTAAASLETLGRALALISFYSACFLRSTDPRKAPGYLRAASGSPAGKESQYGRIGPDESKSSQHKGEAREHQASFGAQSATAPLD